MTNEENYDQLEDFLLGRSKREPEQKEDLADLRRAIEAIEAAEDHQLKQRLQKLEAGLGAPKQEATVRQLKPRRNWLAIAAAVLLLLAGGWFAFNATQELNPRELAVAEFEPYPNIAYSLTKGATSLETLTVDAFTAYEAGDTERAATLMAQLPATPVHQFYLAQSLLAEERFAEASELFFDVSTASGFKLTEEAEYYLALSLLGEEKTGDAQGLLEAIAEDDNHVYHDEAVQLLNRL